MQSLAGIGCHPAPAFQPLWPHGQIWGPETREDQGERACEGEHWDDPLDSDGERRAVL